MTHFLNFLSSFEYFIDSPMGMLLLLIGLGFPAIIIQHFGRKVAWYVILYGVGGLLLGGLGTFLPLYFAFRDAPVTCGAGSVLCWSASIFIYLGSMAGTFIGLFVGVLIGAWRGGKATRSDTVRPLQ